MKSQRLLLAASPILVAVLVALVPAQANAIVTKTPAAQAISFPQRYGVFEEPLVAIGAPTATPDVTLLHAIAQYRGQADALLTKPIEDWLADNPASSWAASLQLNIGLVHRRGGDYALARTALKRVLDLTTNVVSLHERAVGERAVAELIDMELRLGHTDAAAKLLQSKQANWGGYAAAAISHAKTDMATIESQPEDALRCGLVALTWLLRDQNPKSPAIVKLLHERADRNGISLDRLEEIAVGAGLPMRAVRRVAGQAVPVPSVVHWKEGHYAAILGMKDGRYRVRDTALADEVLMRPEVLERESSGYFLVAQKSIAAQGWKQVAATEAAQVIGSGPTTGTTPNNVGNQGIKSGQEHCPSCPNPPPPPPPKSGMPHYAVSTVLVSLNIEDTPVSYPTAKGSSVAFTITYNQLEANQPASFSFSNLGAKWTHNWLSYVQDDPVNVGTNVTLYAPAGGALVYKGYNASTGTFTPETRIQAVLARIVNGTNVSYERRMADGTVWTYAFSDGGASFPRRLFLTRISDPRGNTTTLGYDANLRLTSLTDAQGQTTTFSYTGADPLHLTGITDPFGRTATIGYDAAGRLNSLTDAVGMQSTFAYGADSDISSMTTPYGTTSFSVLQEGRRRQLTVTDPEGQRERFEFFDVAPGIPYSESVVPNDAPAYNAWFNYRNVYYWDRNAMATAEGDYTQAFIRHFLHDTYDYDINTVSGVLEGEKDPLESRVWYSYPNQPDGNLTGGFDKPNRIRRVLDNGTTQHTLMQYNAFGNLTQKIDKAGLETDYTYDANQIDLLQTTEKNAAGNAVTVDAYTWNSQHRPLTHTDAAGLTTTFTYNSAGQPLTATDSLGHQTTWQYDNSGRLLIVTRPDGKTRTFTYDSVGRVATLTNSENLTLSYQYDNLDRVTRITYPDGTYEATTWDRLDVGAHTDRAGRTTSYVHEDENRLTSETDALGHTTSYTSYPAGQLKSRTDANGNTTSWARDIEGRVTSIDNAGEVTTYAYDGAGRVAGATQSDGSSVVLDYDAGDRLVGIHDSLGNSVAYTLDLKGNRTKEDIKDPSNLLVQTHRRVYDSVYRLQQDIGAQNQTTQYAYDTASNVTSLTDPLSRVTGYTYDAMNRVATQTQPAPGSGQSQPVISYAYNGLDQIAQVTDPRGLVTSYTHDGLGNLTQQVSPDTGTTVNTYDVNNKVLTSTDAKGQVTTYTYDMLNRVSTATYNQATGTQLKTIAYTYDQGTNGIGHLSTVTETAADGTTVLQTTGYAYDAKGRMIQETRIVAGVNYVNGYTYEPFTGRLLTMTYPSGRTVSYSYDAMGRITQIGTTAPASQGGQSQLLAFGITYHPFGGVKSYTLGNNRTVTRTYDQDGRIASYSLGGNSITVGYDTASRITSLLDTVNAANSSSYGYDNLGRLTSASVPATNYGYSYDLTGNRLTRNTGATSEITTIDPVSNRISQVAGNPNKAFTYDANGSTTNDGVNTYAYDARGRMVSSVSGIGTTSYQVGANGQRVRKTSTLGDVIFLYDTQGKLIAESTPAGLTKKEYIYLLDLLVGVSVQP
jgi:YD repeat-containing protein